MRYLCIKYYIALQQASALQLEDDVERSAQLQLRERHRAAALHNDRERRGERLERRVLQHGGALRGVEIKADGKMVGNVKSPRILIADGALFKGNIDMDVGR